MIGNRRAVAIASGNCFSSELAMAVAIAPIHPFGGPCSFDFVIACSAISRAAVDVGLIHAFANRSCTLAFDANNTNYVDQPAAQLSMPLRPRPLSYRRLSIARRAIALARCPIRNVV